MVKKHQKVPRKKSSQQTKDDYRKSAKYIYQCRLCGLRIASNHAVAGRVLGPHMASEECRRRSLLNSSREDACEAPRESDDPMAECSGGDGDAVDVDGDVYLSCDGSSFEDEEGRIGDDNGDEDDFGVDSYEAADVGDLDLDDEFVFHESLEAPPTGELMNCMNVAMVTSEVPILSREESEKKGCWYTLQEFGNRVILASRYFCQDHVATQTMPVGPPPLLGPPDRKIYEYQQKLVSVYFTAADEDSGRGLQPILLNKVRGKKKDWRDCITLYFFCCTYKLLSRTAGNALLALVNTLSWNHGFSIPLHSNWRNLVTAVEKKLTSFHPLHRQSWSLPKVFGEKNLQGLPLKPTLSVSYDFMKTVALKLLLTNPSNFHCGPSPAVLPRIISGFFTSDVFINLCSALWKEKGPDAFPLCLMLSWDLSTNRSQNASLTPLVFSFQQASGEGDQIHLAGYFPTDLSQSDKELFKLLKRLWKCPAVGLRKEAIADAKRKYILDYPHSVLAVLLDYEDNGLLLQVGLGDQAICRRFFPMITTFMMDNEEADFFNSTNHMRIGMNSRTSIEQNTWSHPETALGGFVVRDSEMMARLTQKCERVTTQKLSYWPEMSSASTPDEKRYAKPSTTEEEEWKDLEFDRNFYGVTAGANVTYNLTACLERHGIASYHILFPPDKLHTVYQGLLKCVISWTLLIVESFDLVMGTSGMSKLDERIKSFNLHQTLNPTRPVKFADGISSFMKADAGSSRNGTNTGLMSCKTD